MISGLVDWLAGANTSMAQFNVSMLLAAILVPLAVAIALAISGRVSDSSVRTYGVIGFLIPALAGLWLWAVYTAGTSDGGYAFLYKAEFGLQDLGIYLFLGLNGISMPLFVMAGLIGLAAGVYALISIKERLRLFVILMLVMLSGLMGLFASVDIFFFYFFHEFALIPTFIMIAIWGGRGRRSVALELTIYLTFGAMLTLAGLIALYVSSGAESFDMISLRYALVEGTAQTPIFALLLIGFGVLVSLFPFHSWAPRGYATAPAATAMLHAGVLKKFGLYGLIQIALPLLPAGFGEAAPVLLWLALGNVVLIGLVTMAQRDLKLMLGYASVMHMGYAFLGLYAYSAVGVGGAVMMMFAHGFSASLLFMLADMVERRSGTTDMRDLGGMGQKAPVLMAFFVTATMASIGLPGLANFWGEITIFAALWKSGPAWITVAAVSGIVISAIYGLRAVARVFYGEPKDGADYADLDRSERFAALVLILALFATGLWPRFVSDNIDAAVSRDFASPIPVAAEIQPEQ